MKTILSIFLLCLTLLPAVSLPAPNDEVQPQNLLPPGSEQDGDAEPRVSRGEASDIARDTFPGGKVLSIRRDNQNWRIRIDQEGTVSDVLVNADSGRVSRPNGGE